MNRFFFIIAFLISVNSLFAVELWNGFTSDMTEEEALSRAQEILSLVSAPSLSTRSDDNIPLPAFVRNYQIPRRNLSVYNLLSRYNGLEFISPNVILVFFNEKLFSITLVWDTTEQDLINLSRQRFGVPTIMKYKGSYTPFSSPDLEMPMWRLQGKDLFILRNEMIYIDQNARNNYIAEQNRIEQQRRDEEEARRREANSRVQF